MRIGILGAGAGGMALGFEAASKGLDAVVSDLPDFQENVEAILEQGGIFCIGENEKSYGKVRAVREVKGLIESSDLIFVVAPAFGIEPFADACKPYIKKGQKFVICPGSGGGAIEFKKKLGVDLLSEDIVVAETHTLPYAVRAVKPGVISIFHYVDTLIAAALPSSKTEEVTKLLDVIWPGKIKAAKNVLETMLIDGNPVIHPAVTLLNVGLIERTGGDFMFYAEGITDGVADLMQAIDEERLALAKALEIDLPSEPLMSNYEGYIDDEHINYREGYKLSKAFYGIKAQSRLDQRYLTEDVGYVMVFWSTLGQLIGVKTPVMDSIINIASVLLHKDLRKIGVRTAETLGLTAELMKKM